MKKVLGLALVLSTPAMCIVACTADPMADGAGGPLDTNSINGPDAVQGDATTDEGCGGSASPACADGKKCLVGKDCVSKSCQSGLCAAPTTTDGIRNGSESDVDCGGPSAPKCEADKGCEVATDCATGSCNSAKKCAAIGYTDGVKNGGETDVDCGGPSDASGFKACDPGKHCVAASDCTSSVCDAGTHLCNAPSYTDAVKNGDETDVDCGGNPANAGFVACAVGASCVAHSDCASDGCAYDKKCVAYRSCTGHFGGDTCGSGEVDEPTKSHESCCTTAPVTSAGGVQLEKYNITSGRMRTFVERTNGNIQGWLAEPGHKPGWWNDAWTQYLPTGLNTPLKQVGTQVRNLGVHGHFGPNFLYDQAGEFGCWSGTAAGGGPTYWMPVADHQAQNPNDVGNKYPKDLLDQKPLNCADFLMLAAFCAWDGGRLPTIVELDAAWNGDVGTRLYPWGNAPAPAGYTSGYPTPDDPTNYSPLGGDPDLANYHQNYPKTGAQYNYVDNDLASYIAPPGRFPRGAGPYGHMDLAGAVFNVTSTTSANTDDPTTALTRWSRSGSWERADPIPYPVHNSPMLRKYWAQGGRCVK